MRIASLIVLGGLFLVSCKDDDPPSREGPMFTDDGGPVVEPDPMTNCPSSEPKAGENCGPDISESNRCEYTSDCTAPNGATLTESVVYCCVLGVWDSCGGRSPCAVPTVDAGEPTPVPLDAAAPDAGAPDARPDLLPDLAQ